MNTPQTPIGNAHVLKIGIAPETVGDDAEVVLRDRRPARVRRYHHVEPLAHHEEAGAVGPTPRLFVAGSEPEPAKPDLVSPSGEPFTSLTWPKYLEWRKSKCRPYDYTNGPSIAARVPAQEHERITRINRDRALEEIDQATHEFVGEIAELGELFAANGPTTFYGTQRDKLIDECGDILFCGAWVLDAWGKNPLADSDNLELIRVGDQSELAQMAQIIGTRSQQEVLGNGQFIGFMQMVVLRFMLQAQSAAGLLCNGFKKLRYQRREQDVDVQVARVCSALLCINQILVIANSSVEEALLMNQLKLDARYPNGYQAGMGGGNRTGEGA